jgi:hypothetical protein
LCSTNAQLPTPNSLIIEPARHRIAGKTDHAAAKLLDLGDQCVVDTIDLIGHGLDAAARAQRAVERLGQRRKARDIGEQRSTGGSLRQIDTLCQCRAAILGQVGRQ